jgi:cytochrome c oxidase assembly protein subunit 11
MNGARHNRRVALSIMTVVLAMLGLSYAAVPLYALFCRATGYGGTPQRAENAPATVGNRRFTVRFDTNVANGLAWRVQAETQQVSLRTGETASVYFHAENMSPRESVAVAAFNVTPEQMGAWFNKITCFCFNEQRLGPHESLDLPVVFFLDPALETDPSVAGIDMLTLSYTFYAAAAPQPIAGIDAGKPKL